MNRPHYVCAIILFVFMSTAFLPCIQFAGAEDGARDSSRGLTGFTESSTGLPVNKEYAVPGVGRFNNDAYPDIVAGILSWYHTNYGMDAWINNNGASWTLRDTGLPTTGGYGEIGIGDLNSDGYDEVVAPHENAWSAGGATGISIYKSDGAASFSFSAMTAPTASGEWECAALGDIDKDGHLDIVASSGSAGVKVWKGNGGTAWTDTSTGLPTSGQYYGVAFGDMNKDGNLDVVAAGNGGGLRVYTGNGGTGWALATTGLPNGQYLGINISDVDNDNNPDIVAGVYQGGIEVWTGNGGAGGTLTFTQESSGLVTTGFYSMVAVGDVDLDGNRDIWAGEAYGGGMRLYLGNGGAGGSCSWTRYSTDLPGNGPYTGAIMADFDQDGDLDLLASDSGANNGGSVGIRVFLSKTGNNPPVARAGTDQTVPIGTIVQLDGSASKDPDGSIVQFQWNISSAPVGSTVTLNDSTVKNPTLEAQKVGVYKLTLAVKDDKLRWGKGEALVNITVTPLPNKKPIANAGPDKNYKIFTKVQLNGSNSSDEEGIIAYKWNVTGKPAGTNVTLDNDKIVNPTFTPDTIGSYKFTLTVKDINNSWSKDDGVTITIDPAGSGPPTADAGQPSTIELGQTAKLNGSGSKDDQSIALYDWSVASQPAGSYLDVLDVAVQSITPLVEGFYDFSLMVKDNDNLWCQAPATVRVTVLPKNLPPVASITSPEDEAVILSTDIVSFDGSGSSDPEQKDIKYRWASDIDGDLGALPTFTKNLTVGKHKITLSVTDDHDQTVSVSVNIEIKLDTLPTAVLTAKPTLILKGESVKFDGTGSSDKEGAVNELLFDFGDGTAATWGQAKTASHVYTKAGRFNATLTAKDSKGQIGQVSAPVEIIVNERPTAGITATLSVVNVIKPVTFWGNNSADVDGKVVSYYFDFGDGTNSGWVSDLSASKTYTVPGQYSVQLKVKDDRGYESVNTASVNIQVVKPKKPDNNVLGGMLMPLLLIVVVVIVVLVLALVMMKRKKGGAVPQQPPAQVDLMQQPVQTPPPAYDPNQYQPQQYPPDQQYYQQPPQQYYPPQQ